jgi:hypothetical protein
LELERGREGGRGRIGTAFSGAEGTGWRAGRGTSRAKEIDD